MSTPATPEEIARSISTADREALLCAEPADGCEWWLHSPVADTRLASSDLVLTPLGIVVRAILKGQS